MTKTPQTDSPLLTRLLVARERIARGWCQEMYCRDSYGNSNASNSSHGIAWCAAGAVGHDLEDSLGDEAVVLLNQTTHRRYPSFYTIIDFNDDLSTTQDEVLQIFDLAIAEMFAKLPQEETV